MEKLIEWLLPTEYNIFGKFSSFTSSFSSSLFFFALLFFYQCLIYLFLIVWCAFQIFLSDFGYYCGYSVCILHNYSTPLWVCIHTSSFIPFQFMCLANGNSLLWYLLLCFIQDNVSPNRGIPFYGGSDMYPFPHCCLRTMFYQWHTKSGGIWWRWVFPS